MNRDEAEPQRKPKPKPSKGDHPCRKDCSGAQPGKYPSCRGCGHYVICTKHGVALQRRCLGHKFWDDERKRCKRHSRTCTSREVTNGTRP